MIGIEYRTLTAGELSRLGEIDRSEFIDAIYVQRDAELVEQPHAFDVPHWTSDGDHEHSLLFQHAFCERHLAAGGIALGAFDGEQLVGVGVVTPHVRSSIAQLAYLHVSDGHRDRGIGRRLVEIMDDIARAAGDTSMVVSATPSLHTVRFYMGCGFTPTAEPLPELFEKEPDDVHLSKPL